jgi:hypothetical protein
MTAITTTPDRSRVTLEDVATVVLEQAGGSGQPVTPMHSDQQSYGEALPPSLMAPDHLEPV